MQALSYFFEQISAKMQSPVQSLAHLIKDVNNVALAQQQHQQTSAKTHQNLSPSINAQADINIEAQSGPQNKAKSQITIGEFFTRSLEAIISKQSEDFQHLEENLRALQIEETPHSRPQLNMQNSEYQLMGQQLQKLQKLQKQAKQAQLQQNLQQTSTKIGPKDPQQPQILQKPQIQQLNDNFSFADSTPPTKVQEAQHFCSQLGNQFFNQKLYTQSAITTFVNQITQTQKNNSYRCLQESFEKIKTLYHISNANGPKSVRKNSSSRNLESAADFNLELTMRSKLSKQSGANLDRQDSLVYSNATSFGLQKDLRSKEVSARNSSTRLLRPKDEAEFDQIIHMEKTSSKGEIDNTENEFSVKQVSDSEQMKQLPRNSASRKSFLHSSESKRSDSRENRSSKGMANQANNILTSKQPKHIPAGAFINEQDNYQIVPLTQKAQGQTQKASINTFGVETPQKPIKKSYSIKTYSNGKLNNSRTTQKRSDEASSVFSAEISQLQSRISKIKETKILRKLKLQQQLKKVNQELEQLKIHQENQENTQSHIKHKSSHASSKQKSAFESRIKINDDLEEKKKAVNLVKSLKAEKISRQNQKRNQHKAFNADLHQQMEDMVRLKYFNQERVKQKRQLEIIERMKQQEMRKIIEQKQKQESIEFLSKLKHNQPVERGDSKVSLAKENKNVPESPVKKTQESPVRRSEEKEMAEPLSNGVLEKKKLYMKKVRNFTIIKKGRDDLYEQALN